MTKQYYECHITMTGNKENIKPLVEAHKWKFSAIDGDPTLGDGIKCYATRHFNTRVGELSVLNRLHEVADILKNYGINVIRRKIEKVIYDDRNETVKCDGACPECHLEDLT